MNRSCSHNRISEWGMVQAIGLHILYWLSDHRVKTGYKLQFNMGKLSFLTINVNGCRGVKKRFKLL